MGPWGLKRRSKIRKSSKAGKSYGLWNVFASFMREMKLGVGGTECSGCGTYKGKRDTAIWSSRGW